MKAIVVIPTQGFGNRLRMIASSFILAEYMKLDHYILWKVQDDCNIEFDKIWEKHPFKLMNETNLSKLPYRYYGDVHTHSIMNQVLNPGNIDYLVLLGGHEFKHPVMTKDEFIRKKYQLYSQLKFHCESQVPYISEKFICVHYRDVTDFDIKDVEKSEKCNFSKNSPLKQFLYLMKKINDSIPIVVVTNNTLIGKSFVSYFPEKKIHFFNFSKNRNENESVAYSLYDFVLMTKAKCIIGTYYSSFSDEASFFNIIPKIIPLHNTIEDEKYHCFNFILKNKCGFLNYNHNTILKYFQHSM